jgi:hypothetical protein
MDEDREVDMEELEPEVDEKVLGKWVVELGGGKKGKGVGGDGNVVQGECGPSLFSLFFRNLSFGNAPCAGEFFISSDI